MGNTFTNLNIAKISQEAATTLAGEMTPLSVFSLSVGGDAKELFGTVSVPLITLATAEDNATDYEAAANTTVAGKVVTLSNNISRSWSVSAVEVSKQGTDLVNAQMNMCVKSVAAAVQLKALNLVTSGAFSATSNVAAASFDTDYVIGTVRKACFGTLKFTDDLNPALVLDSEYFNALLVDDAIKYQAYSGTDSAATGKIIKYAGFRVSENAQLASSTPYGATGYLRGFACVPSALAIAIRPPVILDGDWIMNEIAIDPATGAAINIRMWLSKGANKLFGCAEVLFGGAVVDGSALYRITAQ